MSFRFDKAFEILLENEGGFSNEAFDPGGRTLYGITEAYDPDAFAAMYALYLEGKLDEAKEIAKQAYEKKYWKTQYEDIKDSSLAFKVFDLGVNVGPKTIVRMLQGVLNEFQQNLTLDGIFGPATLNAIADVDPEELYTKFIARVEIYYRSLSTFNVFGKGWLRRLHARHWLD